MFILIGYVENIKIHVFISLIPVPDNDGANDLEKTQSLKCRLFCRRQTIAVAGNQLEIALFHCIYFATSTHQTAGRLNEIFIFISLSEFTA